jgi:hypothetical protein
LLRGAGWLVLTGAGWLVLAASVARCCRCPAGRDSIVDSALLRGQHLGANVVVARVPRHSIGGPSML